jgi:hypothetical protein
MLQAGLPKLVMLKIAKQKRHMWGSHHCMMQALSVMLYKLETGATQVWHRHTYHT